MMKLKDKVAIITGAGTAFCSGLDLKAMTLTELDVVWDEAKKKVG